MGVPKAPQCTTNELKDECEEKDGTTGQESRKASYDETGTIASDEFRHFGSSGCCKKNAESRIRSSADRGGKFVKFLARRKDRCGWFPLLNRYIGRADDRAKRNAIAMKPPGALAVHHLANGR